MNTWRYLYMLHKDQTGIVIGNGPSLNDIPNSFLYSYPTFGTNHIHLRENFTPTYYVAVNALMLDQSLSEIESLTSNYKFIRDNYADRVNGSVPIKSNFFDRFSYWPEYWINEGGTVTYVALQLAFWMGFKRILLVGVDHDYVFEGAPNEEHFLGEPDRNHFDERYFWGSKWNNPDLAQSETSYWYAKRVFEANYRDIFNCSTRTKLEVFPKADWRDFVVA